MCFADEALAGPNSAAVAGDTAPHVQVGAECR